MDWPIDHGDIWLSEVLKHVRDGVICVNPAGKVVWMNPAAVQLAGQPESHDPDPSAATIFNSLERGGRNLLTTSVQSVLQNGIIMHEPNYEFLCTDGRTVHMEYTVSPVSQSGECLGALVVLSPHEPIDVINAGGHFTAPREKLSQPVKGAQRRVLVMDDDDVVRTLTVQKLIRLGYDSEGASDGEAAVKMFQTARDSGKPFDVVVLDLIVRGGMGGKESLEMLRDIDSNVKAILTSGYAVDPVLTNFWEYGFFGVIRKPFVIKELDVAIRRALAELNNS